jgi:hypothetical protein
MAAKLRLDDVTLCAADCLHPALAARAMEICLDRADFADAVLFADVAVPGRFRSEAIPPIRSLADYSRFCLKALPDRVTTRFVLVVQWDGYIVDPTAWTREFLRYDYIGAPGYSHPAARDKAWVVGNGGFSLRSRRLLDAVKTLPAVAGMAEDQAICEVFRGVLEKEHKIRFAPVPLADRFCYQQRTPAGPTFGFHGLHNLHRVEDDDAVVMVAEALTPRERLEVHFFNLLHRAMNDGRTELARRLYALIRRDGTPAALQARLAQVSGMPELAAREIARLEALGSV